MRVVSVHPVRALVAQVSRRAHQARTPCDRRVRSSPPQQQLPLRGPRGEVAPQLVRAALPRGLVAERVQRKVQLHLRHTRFGHQHGAQQACDECDETSEASLPRRMCCADAAWCRDLGTSSPTRGLSPQGAGWNAAAAHLGVRGGQQHLALGAHPHQPVGPARSAARARRGRSTQRHRSRLQRTRTIRANETSVCHGLTALTVATLTRHHNKTASANPCPPPRNARTCPWSRCRRRRRPAHRPRAPGPAPGSRAARSSRPAAAAPPRRCTAQCTPRTPPAQHRTQTPANTSVCVCAGVSAATACHGTFTAPPASSRAARATTTARDLVSAGPACRGAAAARFVHWARSQKA